MRPPDRDTESPLEGLSLAPGQALPAGLTITAPLPPRWGLLRWLGRDGAQPVEVWTPVGAPRPLPEPLRRLLTVRHPSLQEVRRLLPLPSGHELLVLTSLAHMNALPQQERTLRQPALQVLEPLCRALDALHAAGLCHLELRPEHIFVGGERLVLSGLGQVQIEGRAPAAPGGEPPGQGTLLPICAYLAPEQILPERSLKVQRRTDVYALSALAFHLLAGVPPFGPDGDMATLGAHLGAWRPRCTSYRPDLSEAVDAVLARGLALDAQQRPPSCLELYEDLRAALAVVPQRSAPPGLTPACALVVAGSAAARRELQGIVSAVSSRHPVLADAGTHARTLALRYRPAVLLVHQPSLPAETVLALCRALSAEASLAATEIVVLLGAEREGASELAQLGITVVPLMTSSSSSPSLPSPLSGRTPDNRPLVQLLRRLLQPASSRSTLRPGPA
jgi:hypothetical protein